MSPIKPSAFRTARALILAQHQELRGLLRTGAVLAGAASRGDRPCLNELPNLIESLRERFSEHLAFEEASVLPMLQSGDQMDPPRAELMKQEHGKQRREFELLLRLASSQGDPQTVAFSFQSLLNALLKDMEEEERWLLHMSDDATLRRNIC